MPFAPTISVKNVASSRPGPMEGSDKLFIDRRLRDLTEKFNTLAAAVKEMQDWLIANT